MINKILRVLAVFFFCLTTFTAGAANIPAGTKLYLKLNNNWSSADAKYVAFFCNGSAQNEWVDMKESAIGCNVYEVAPTKGPHKNVLFCRMAPGTKPSDYGSWTNPPLWNKTSDLTWNGSTTNNMYTIKKDTWSEGGGTWGNLAYYVAGNGKNNSPWCDGKDWDNKGSKFDNSTGVVTFSGVKAGSYEFKVTDGTWDVTFGSDALDKENSTKNDCRFKDLGGDGNVKFTLTETADITIKFSGCKITVTATFATPMSYSYVLMGIGGDWDNGVPLEVNPKNKNELMLLNQPIDNKKDAVKIVKLDICGNKVEYEADVDDSPCSAKVTGGGNENIKLPTGTYDFYYRDGEIYITPSPSAIKYVLMGVNGDWANGIELKPSDENDYELVLLGQEISKATDAIKIVKKNPCGDEFYAEVKIDSPVPYSGGGTGDNPSNIVLEDGIYDFYLDKNTGKIYIGGEIKDAQKVFLDPKVGSANTWRDPNETWDKEDARIAVYYFTYDDSKPVGWVTAAKCNSYFYAQIPAGYDGYNWVRIKGDTNDWDHDVNQTDGIKYDSKNTLTKLTGWDQDDHNEIPYSGVCGEDYENIVCEKEELVIVNDTVFVTINQFVEADPCKYVFKSFEQAFAVLKTKTDICETQEQFFDDLREDVITLKKHVVMQVVFGPMPYRGTEYVGMSGGHVADASAIFFRNINNTPDAQYSLVVRTADPKGNRAVLVHPVIRRSRNITLSNLDIISDPDLRDNALDIDTGEGLDNLEGLNADYNIVELPEVESNITLKNCYVESYGRNGIHIVGIKGLHVENNEFYTKYDFSVDQTEGEDVVDWGGTIKFINCTDVKFLRNNSEGTLATSFFIQGCQRMLIMNNVFWNDNTVKVANLDNTNRTVANVRLVNYGTKAAERPVKNIGIYYNTFFIKDNNVGDGSYDRFDFFRLGGLKQPVIAANFDPKTIRFQYNNCYSYDDDIKGNNDDETNTTTFYLQGIGKSADWCQCFKYNNFWSAYDKINHKSSSAFEVGKFCVDANETYNAFIDVPSQVCKTDPTRPASLVVKGEGLNIGTLISEDEDVSEQGAHLLFNDRLNPDNGVNSIRPHSSVDNKNESLTPYDKIYKEPGTINLYTSPIVGSQSSDVLITSIKLTPQKSIKLNLVDKEGNSLIDVEECKPLVDSRFAITTADGTPICSLTTDNEGNLDDVPVYVTFIRPTGVTVNTTYEAFLIIEPSQDADAQLILTIPIRGHYIAKIESIPGTWTIGAFQQREEMPVDTIVWHGSVSTDWDNRNNWYKTDGTLVTCLDALTEDLTVIIPNKDSEKYITPPDGIYNYPSLPKIASKENFGKVRNDNWNGEQVNAGDNETATKVANKIYMEYGSALVGVEELGDKRYSEVESEFVARRNDWLLVGGVVNPFDTDEEGNLVIDVEGNKVYRPMVSGDYFLNYLPHVYMHSANINKSVLHADEDSVGWDESFAALNVEVDPRRVFAIRLPNQYGNTYNEKLPAVVYNRKNQTNYDPKEPYTYKFNGRFYNESKVLYYDGLTPEKPVLLTNTYPANINAYKLQEDKGTIQIYDYDKCSFVAVAADNQDAEILSQHGFLFTPKSGLTALNVAKDYFKNTETGHRSVAEEVLSFRIQLSNNKESVASEVYIRYDELKDDAVDYASDAPKAFNGMIKVLPELYVMRYDKKWSGISIPDISKPIPLGVKMQASNQVLTFSISNVNMPYDIILEDRFADKTYNLSAGEQCVVDDLVAGNNCEGRFYIMLQENATDEEENLGDDVTTDVEDAVESSPMIDIFTNGNQLVVSANNEVELQTIIISDMSGKHQVYNVSGQYVALTVPASTGVYTVNVIGDTTSVIEKVKLN